MGPEASCALESVGALRALCDGLRRDLTKATELKKTSPMGALSRMAVSEGSMSLLELKEVNRTVWEQIAALKARSHGANQDVDAADLKLQNLQYEKNCVLREIRLLRDYPPDKPIDLLGKEEFVRLAPPGTVTEEQDGHEFHVARLQLELNQRASLCEQRDQLLAERQRLAESITARRAYLCAPHRMPLPCSPAPHLRLALPHARCYLRQILWWSCPQGGYERTARLDHTAVYAAAGLAEAATDHTLA